MVLTHHHHHHLFPLILSLSLLILPSSSRTHELPALFSVPDQYLSGGQNLTDGNTVVSLSNDCSLTVYLLDILVTDYQTSTTTSNCILHLNNFGQFILTPSDEPAKNQTIYNPGPEGDYALLFVGGIAAIYGPATWNNGVPISTSTLKQRMLNAGSSDTFIASSQSIIDGTGLIAQNGNVEASITEDCTLVVSYVDTGVIIWDTPRVYDNLTGCFLLFTYGELLLQGYSGSTLVTQWTGGYPAVDIDLLVAALRYNGRIDIYGFQRLLTPPSASATAAAVAENIKMVTA
ncbi:alpha-D-mannose-specific plant lectins domain-containing protein [Dioscorea alata]|uniref:Alpha-D-mannose-specific plant lectins domain-containing protein n=1 Tax=Dioscorea alata TaxID=55571 RepID=A0ACB7VC83_DIOAL|nr:alpha-D-mannose-specific plant lectins domain-containing protein [Dioscorea alata]